MKYLLTFAVLLSLSFPAAAQIDGTGTLTKRNAVQSADPDDDGLLPITMATPFGDAIILTHSSGVSLFTIPAIGFSFFGFLSNLPPIPGMENATAGLSVCLEKHTGGSPHSGAKAVITKATTFSATKPTPDGAAKAAVAALHAYCEEGGWMIVPCVKGNG